MRDSLVSVEVATVSEELVERKGESLSFRIMRR